MDGDQSIKQHERLMARSVNATNRGRATGRFQQAMQTRGNAMGISQAPDRTTMSYDYGYTGNAFPGGLLQSNDVQAFGAEYSRPRQTRNRPLAHSSHSSVQAHLVQQQQPHQQHQQHPNVSSHLHQSQSNPESIQQQARRRGTAETTPLVPYESAMMYGFSQQGSAHGSFDVVPQYSTRQSAAIEALSNQIAMPQYFPGEPTGTGVPGLSPYLHTLPYNHPDPMARPPDAQPFPTTMAEYTSMGAGSAARLDPPVQQEQHHEHPAAQVESHQRPVTDPSSFQHAYAPYQRALGSTLDQTRAGRLVEASRSLLEISERLVANARDLGILHDDPELKPYCLQLWNEFNLCWLAVCQKQKDLTQGVVATGHPPSQTSLLSRDRMETMGMELIQLCDQLEQHGLVDYQMGVWEEEILSVLGQCLDLMESKPELLRFSAIPEPATATQRP